MYPKHALQRLESPSRSLSFVFHLAGICSFLASFVHLTLNPQLPPDSFGGDFQFLTIIGLALSLLTFVIAYGADLTLLPEAFAAKNSLAVCVAPLEVLISILYWSLKLYDENLLIPPELDIHLPLLADLGYHAAPALFLSLDLLLFSPPWTIQLREALALSTGLAIFYWQWVEVCYGFNETYPYPIFEILETEQRVVLFAAAAVLMTISTGLLKEVYHRVNGVEEEEEEEEEPIKED